MIKGGQKQSASPILREMTPSSRASALAVSAALPDFSAQGLS
jgi:hypothetical protein